MAKDDDKDAFGSQTIVGVVDDFLRLPKSIEMELQEKPGLPERRADPSEFKIRVADTLGRRSSANLLIEKRYSWRGYQTTFNKDAQPNRITLVASHEERTIGTITIGFDSAVGLLVDDLYKDEIDPLRRSGRRPCEFTKLAVDSNVRSKRVLAALFHIAFIYAKHVRGFTDIFIEVNPRHVAFYERMLGFKRLGQERMNPRVQAPAVLLWLDFKHIEDQILLWGGKCESAVGEKSLYPFGFSANEVEGIAGRLRQLG